MNDLIEAFNSPKTRLNGTYALAALGEDALSLLQSVLDGSYKNAYGHSYKHGGEVCRCALVVVRMLGPIALPLEPVVIDIIYNYRENCMYVVEAVSALGAIGCRSEASLLALAHALDRHPEIAGQAVHEILKNNLTEQFWDHPLIAPHYNAQDPGDLGTL